MNEENISEQMSFEEYLKQVEACLLQKKRTTEQMNQLMMEYADDLKEYYELSLDPITTAAGITSGLL